MPSHSAPNGAPGAETSMILKVPPYLLPAAVEVGEVAVVEGGTEAVADGLVVAVAVAVVATGVVAAVVAAVVVVFAGVVAAGVGDVVLLQPITMKANIRRTVNGTINFFTLLPPNICYLKESSFELNRVSLIFA